MVDVFEAPKMKALIEEQYEDNAEQVIGQVNNWLARGDGIAVYENADLGHPEVGVVRLASYGSPAAQLEIADAAHLPKTLPDTPTMINWRYQLKGTYRGEPLR